MRPKALIIKPSAVKYRSDVGSMSQEMKAEITNINFLLDTLHVMHKNVSSNHTRIRSNAQRYHNSKTSSITYSFHVGHHVMVWPASARKSKLTTKWTGPMRITEAISYHVFVVEDWRKLKRKVVHAQRLLPFPNTQTDRLMNRKMRNFAQYLDGTLQLVDKLQDIRLKDGEHEIFVSWKGWEKVHERLWRPVVNVMEDIPEMLKDLLYTRLKHLKSRILQSYYYGIFKYIMGCCSTKIYTSFINWIEIGPILSFPEWYLLY